MRRHFGQCVAEVSGFNMTGLFPLSKGRSAVNKVTVTLCQTGLVVSVVLSLAVGAQEGPHDGPRYENDTSLVRPTDYREWTFLSSYRLANRRDIVCRASSVSARTARSGWSAGTRCSGDR